MAFPKPEDRPPRTKPALEAVFVENHENRDDILRRKKK
jgi:hypothetical protein